MQIDRAVGSVVGATAGQSPDPCREPYARTLAAGAPGRSRSCRRERPVAAEELRVTEGEDAAVGREHEVPVAGERRPDLHAERRLAQADPRKAAVERHAEAEDAAVAATSQ